MPTYKRSNHSGDYVNKNGQAPSYTDRVLIYTKNSIVCKILHYSSLDLVGSDHRPVNAIFSLHIPYPYTIVDWTNNNECTICLEKIKLYIDREYAKPEEVTMQEYYFSEYMTQAKPICH